MPGRLLLAALAWMCVTSVMSSAAAQPPPANLLARVGAYAERFETMRKTASYDVEGKLESLDGHGRTESTKSMRARVASDGHKLTFSILQYVEDGQDKTADARDKQKQRDADASRHPSSRPKREWRMPFHPHELSRYVFEQLEVDPRNPSHVRIGFVPRTVEDDTIEGSAWVDTASGGILSAGFKLSKPPSIVDSIHVTMTFGETTSLGPAPSRIEVDARGGFLFFRKRYHGEAVLSGYRLAP